MRSNFLALLSFSLLPIMAFSATDSEQSPPEMAYPAEVSLQETMDGSFKYVLAHSNLRLYVYDQDSPGQSNCTGGCAHAWPPLPVEANSKPVGEWTVLERQDGLKQWTYKGQPVYLRYHDSVGEPQGNKPSEGWHFLEP